MVANSVWTLASLLSLAHGAEVSAFQLPWVAGISHAGENLFSCSGSLIGGQWVLTSADCQVEAGDTIHLNRHDMYNFAEAGAEKVAITDVVRHPKFDNTTLSHNFALLRVCSGFSTTPVQMSNNTADLVSAMIAGWGTASSDGVTLSKKMHSAKASTLPLGKCDTGLTDSSICAQISDSYACPEAKGTPLFVDGVLMGLTQSGPKDCNGPRVFSRVDSALEWIETTMKIAKPCEGPPRKLQAVKCSNHPSCGACAGEQADGSFCYWCASSQTCYHEQEWLDDEICKIFSTQRSECGLSATDGTNTAPMGTNTPDSDDTPVDGASPFCGSFSSCGECAGQTYNDGAGAASCFWCGEQNSCISTSQWEAGTACSMVAFSNRDCKIEDQCAWASTCGDCMQSGYTDFFGAYEACAWCGSSCVSESRAGPSCPNPQKVCMPAGGSAKTCSQLGWTVAPGSELCGESEINGQCSHLLSYNLAKLWCQEAGARLCTSSELSANVAAFTGCKLDNDASWTSDVCANGHISQAGASAHLDEFPPACDADKTKRLARCCADEPGGAALPSPVPRKSCSTLGWDTAPGSPLVCAQSVVNGMCIHQADFLTAQTSCMSLGARLCTVTELEDNEAKGTGCKLDDEEVWSSSACSNGAYTTAGSYSGSERTCEALTSKRAVRCCSDIDLVPGIVIYRHTCEDLGWAVQPSGKCAESNVNGRCSPRAAWGVAKDTCTDVGARVCTDEELEAGIGGGSGCKLDEERVWSFTKCADGFISMAGHPKYLGDTPKQCTPATTNLPVRCCADSSKPALGYRPDN